MYVKQCQYVILVSQWQMENNTKGLLYICKMKEFALTAFAVLSRCYVRCRRQPQTGDRKWANLLAGSLAHVVPCLYRVGHSISWPGQPG